MKNKRIISNILQLSLIIVSLIAPARVSAFTPSTEWEECARLAQTGDSDAQYRMGMMYQGGVDVEQNDKEAFYWFRKAASNGNCEAMLEVGKCFRDGLGVIPDLRIAAENFWRAAEKGSPEGAYNYAGMLRDGVGVEQDKCKAYVWFSKAAEAGYSDAAIQARQLSGYANKNKENIFCRKRGYGKESQGKEIKIPASKKTHRKKSPSLKKKLNI